jgi:hypothetical protein
LKIALSTNNRIGNKAKEENFVKDKTYTDQQLQEAKTVAKVLSRLPSERHGIVLMMVDAFVNGMETQKNIGGNSKTTRMTILGD